jgi:2,2-dialkylglycine decarboxylase (pyruvate)
MAKMTTGGFEVVGFDRSWHGVTGGAAASTYSGARQGYGPTLPGSLALPTPDAYRSPFVTNGHYNWQEELDFGFQMLDRQSVGRYAAFIAEPILSAAGIIELPPGYLKALQNKCIERDMLLVLDEAQTGLGRTGDRFAFEHEGVVPDILTLSKTLGAGLPLSATITSAEIEQQCHDQGYIFEQLLTLKQRHAPIGDVRGRGLMLGVELVEDRESKTPARKLGLDVSRRCLELGASLNIGRHSMANIFRIAPPLTVSREQIDTAVSILDQALTECTG